MIGNRINLMREHIFRAWQDWVVKEKVERFQSKKQEELIRLKAKNLTIVRYGKLGIMWRCRRKIQQNKVGKNPSTYWV